MLVTQPCPAFCDRVDVAQEATGSSIHGILQVKILEWLDIPFSRGSSQPKDQTQVSYPVDFFTIWVTREAHK